MASKKPVYRTLKSKTPVVGYKPVRVNGKPMAVPVTKTGNVPKDYLRAVNAARTSSARTRDARILNKKTVGKTTVSQAQAQKWLKNPGRADIANVDTKFPRKKARQ